MNTEAWSIEGGAVVAPSAVVARLKLWPLRVWAASLYLLLAAGAACVPSLFSHLDSLAIAPHHAFEAPGPAHWFGTDQSGRDVFARVVYGARKSLLIGVLAMTLAAAVALLLGLCAGLGHRRVDQAISGLLNVLFAFPPLVLALLFVASFGAGLVPLIVATGLGASPGYARMVRGQVLGVRHAPYIQAARVLGHAPLRILWRQIIPNTVRPLVVTVTMGVGQLMVWASALSFLGLGQPPPSPEWGTMLSMGRDFVATAWWLTCMPGLAIVLTALATTVVGRYWQRVLEGRL